MDKQAALSPHLTHEVKIIDAWFGVAEAPCDRSPHSQAWYGFYVSFELHDRHFIHQIHAIALGDKVSYTPLAKQQMASTAFLNIARIVYSHKLRLLTDLKGRKAVVEVFGGYTITYFKILGT